MANRKVLINRHTSGSSAPVADSMYLGEIAVAHETGKETLFTKNNANEMVPFISCGQTIDIIDSKIKAADVSYDVKAKEGETFIKVEKGTNGSAVTFTLSSEDIQSKKAFDAYSAATDATIKENYNTLSGAINNVLDIVTTAITGDDIIKVDPTTSGAGTYKLIHEKALATDGFKKLTTDAYGHVTAATPVTTEDIQALGFKTSAQTGEDLNALSASVVTNKTNIEALSGGTLQLSADTHNKIVSVYNSATSYADSAVATAIEGLDSEAKVTTGKYLTGIVIADGKISGFTEAELPKLSSATTGNGNVVTDIQVTDHKITFVKGMTVASDADLKAVSGIVNTFSAATEAKFANTDAAITTLSGNVVDYVKSVSGNIESVINAMDKDASAADGQVVTTVSQVDGKVSETKVNVKDLQLGGYSKDASASGSIIATDTINAALSKLENIIAANEISNKDGSIVVTEPTGTATTTDVKVNIKSGEKVIKLDENGLGLYTNLDLVKITSGLGATVKESYEFRDSNGNKIGASIDIAKDSHIVSITYDKETQKLIYEYIDASGATKTTEVDMGNLVLETEVENGIQAVKGVLSIKLDTTGNDTGDGKFLTVGPDGLKLDGVSDAITAAVNALDVTDTAAAGQYVSSVSETDGKIAVSRANVSDAVLNGYEKGEKPASTEITATDNVKGAIAKLEHQIDNAKAAATTKVVEGTDEGNNMTITSATNADNSVTYTVNLTDVASKAALDAEIAARKAVDGQDGQTYVANTGASYIADATSLNDADVKLDAALKAEETARTNQDNTIEASVGLAEDGSHVKTTGTYTSTATTVVGEIAALDSALKAVSDRVGKKLTFTGGVANVEYNGSEDKTITFGSPVNATDITGRSLSITDGVVDVEIIDCGTY